MRKLIKFSALLGLGVVVMASPWAPKAQAQGFGIGIVTPGAAIGIGSGYYGGGYNALGFGGGIPGTSGPATVAAITERIPTLRRRSSCLLP